MDDDLLYVLVYSPLVGPLTWGLVRLEMEQRGLAVIAPTLSDHPNSNHPYWQQHAKSIARNLTHVPQNQGIVLVAHSGAGPLLPIVRQSMPHSIVAYVFVDAGIPRDGLSRLDLMRLQDPQWANQFHQELLQGGRFPTWDEDDLREEIPDDTLRWKLVAEINPRSLEFFTEPIPVFAGWPDAPCAFIKFSASYDWDFDQARRAGWLVRQMNAGHFHMLVDPPAVTDVIIGAVKKMY